MVPDPDSADPDVRLTAWVHGYVQGVGFRWWTRSRALELGLTGFAANTPDGRVQVVAQGPRSAARAAAPPATEWSNARFGRYRRCGLVRHR